MIAYKIGRLVGRNKTVSAILTVALVGAVINSTGSAPISVTAPGPAVDTKVEVPLTKAESDVIDAKNIKIAAAMAKADKVRRKKEGVSIGMSKQEVLESLWGKPQKINRTINARGVREQWVYGNSYLYFNEDTLTTIQN